MLRYRFGVAALLGIIGTILLSTSPSTQGRRNLRFDVERINDREVVAREVLVKLREPRQRAQVAQLASDIDPEDIEPVGASQIFRVRSRSLNTTTLMAVLANRPDVEYVEPNFVVQTLAEPNDPMFPQLWGLAKVASPDAWNMSVGSAANVVAVIDTGVDYAHPDLASTMWSAPAPFTVTIGGVSITCPAGTHGFNAILRTCNPMDDHNHGTHVSGTIGGVGNNGIGVAGVNWVGSVMGLKFLDAGGSGTVAGAIDAIEFAIQAKQAFAAIGAANVRVLSNSWGGGDFSQALLDQINAANSHDMLFVAAAGNSGVNNDWWPTYPASYNAPNIVAVAATTITDDRAFFSNYSANSVHLGAPGMDILSTIRGNTYASMSGTSMATPHVSGAAALVLSQCLLTTSQLKTTLLDSVDLVPSMATTTTTGGRLNVSRALHSCTTLPDTPTNLVASGGDAQVRLRWSASLGATSYNVKRSSTPGGPYALIASNIKTTQFIDTGLVNGATYYYVVSGRNVLGESADSAEVPATPNVPGDLVVSSFTGPGKAGAGSTIVVSVTAKNQGAGTAAPSTTRFYLSANGGVDASDTILNGIQTVPALSPGAVLTTSVSLSIPVAGLTPGMYFLLAKVDSDDVVLESQEGNNTGARLVTIGPDLAVTTLTAPTTAAPGDVITVSHSVKNHGGGAAEASSLKFYLSSNSTLDAGDTFLAATNVPSLEPDATASGQTTMTLPSGLPIATYYVIAEADATKVVPEAYEANNTLSRAVQIGADLLVSAFTVPAKSGGVITVTDTTANQGSGGVPQTVTRFYLSGNSVWDTSDTLLQGHRVVPALEPGASNSASTSVTIPPNLSPGTYYIIAKADADNAAVETQEGNNTFARSTQIGGDLVISALTVPSKLGAGGSFVVTDTTKNQGSTDVGVSLTQFYLSTDAVLSSNDVLLNGNRSIGALAAGEASTGSTTVTIPSGMSLGSYYFFAKADAANTVNEAAETNNTSIKIVTIGPDLIMSNMSISSPVRAGAAAVITDTVKNQGGGDAGPSIVRYYLSTNYTFDAGDVLLSEHRSVPAIAGGTSLPGSTSVTIPAGTPAAFYYVFAKADADGSVVETSETNNGLLAGLTVTN